jgi:hypothetical protein
MSDSGVKTSLFSMMGGYMEVIRYGSRQLGDKLGIRMAQGASRSDRSHVEKSVAEVTEVRIGCKHSSGSTVFAEAADDMHEPVNH